MKRTILLIPLILSLVFLPLANVNHAHAYQSVASQYGFSTNDYFPKLYTLHPSAGAGASAIAQSFRSTTTGYLVAVTVATGIISDPVLDMKCALYGTSQQTISGVPNATIFAESTNVADGATTSLDYDETETFLFNGTYQITTGTWYQLVFYVSSYTSGNSTSYESTAIETDTSVFNGRYNVYSSSAWGAGDTTSAAGHIVYVNTVAGEDYVEGTDATALPTGGLDVDTSDTDEVMEALIGYGVPVVIMLLPSIFIWLIGGRGKWPLLIGISIGTGFGYLFGLVPVWLVFLISIGVVGFAYQSVRSGN